MLVRSEARWAADWAGPLARPHPVITFLQSGGEPASPTRVFSPGRSSLSWPTSTHGAASPRTGCQAFFRFGMGMKIQSRALDVVRSAARLRAKAASTDEYAGQRVDQAWEAPGL
jgi:hypothetical protein